MAEDSTPDTTPEDNPFADNMKMFRAYIDGRNPKPDTASGVGSLMETAFELASEKGMADLINIVDPETGIMVNAVLTPGGVVSFSIQDEIDARRETPRFRRGVAVLTSLDSLIVHVNRFGDADSVVFANDEQSSPSLLAVLDYHREDSLASDDDAGGSTEHGEYRHGLHRSRFSFPVSDEWKAWHANNGVDKAMDMAGFAAFLEDRILNIAEIDKVPASAARFVEINGGEKMIADWQGLTKLSRGLRIDENSTVSEAINLASGEGELTITNVHDAEVGGVKVKVPTMFFIEVPIFREGAYYRVPARLRYRKARGSVTFWYELWNSDRSFKHAFDEAVERVRNETSAKVLFGSPEA
jgi:hypothetical protein